MTGESWNNRLSELEDDLQHWLNVLVLEEVNPYSTMEEIDRINHNITFIAEEISFIEEATKETK